MVLLLKASMACTVTLKGEPEVTLAGAVTLNFAPAPAMTVAELLPEWVPSVAE